MLAYYHQADALARNVTTEELFAWFTALPNETRAEMLLLNPAQWPNLATLQRYLLEVRGISVRAHMLAHLTLDELAYWVDDSEVAY